MQSAVVGLLSSASKDVGADLPGGDAGTGASASPKRILQKYEEQAVLNYAKAHDLDANEISISTVEQSEEGLEGWFAFQQDCSARSKLGQSFRCPLFVSLVAQRFVHVCERCGDSHHVG